MFDFLRKFFFTEFEDDSVVFMVKAKKGNQKYSAICWFKVYGYWKFKYDWRWKRLGVIYEEDSGSQGGKWNDSKIPKLLVMCEEHFVSTMRNGIRRTLMGNPKSERPIADLIPLLDSDEDPRPQLATKSFTMWTQRDRDFVRSIRKLRK